MKRNGYNLIKLFLILISIFLLSSGIFLNFKSPSKTIYVKDFLKSKFPVAYSKIREVMFEFDREIPGIGDRLNLPLFQIGLNKKDINHFNELYQKSGSLSKDYAKNNTWRKALLKHKGVFYKIKIKAHGRQPSGHQLRNFISFAIY